MANCHLVVDGQGEVYAFLLAFQPGASCDSPNHLWFCRSFERFVYADRVVVDPACQGRGMAPRAQA